MNKLKDGVSGVSHTVTGGIAGLGHTFQDGYNNAATAKDKLFMRHKDFDVDDELIDVYKDDINTSVAGLKYLLSQLSHLGKSYWPLLLKTNVKVINTFITLIGAGSLQFKDIDKYYQEFTNWQAENVVPMVHPKERQFLIESVCAELTHYRNTMSQLSARIVQEWGEFIKVTMAPRFKQIIKNLKDTLKLIKLRIRKKFAHEKLQRKTSKLMSKTSPLTDKEQAELNDLEFRTKQALTKYNTVNDKLKSILPHVLAFLEEFVETITTLLICKQMDVYRQIDEALKSFVTFHGLAKMPIESSNATVENNDVYDYAKVIELWEIAIEPIRTLIESSLSIIKDKNPTLADEEMDADVKDPLKLVSFWNKASNSLKKKNPVKPHDNVNGIFGEHQAADPLRSYEKYKNPLIDPPNVYNPGMISIDDVVVPHSLQYVEAKDASVAPYAADPSFETVDLNGSTATSTVESKVPPPLPPRSNRPLPPLPVSSQPTSPRNLSSPLFAPIFSPPPPQAALLIDIPADEIPSDDDADLDSDMMSHSLRTSNSSFRSTLLDSSNSDDLEKVLMRIYNKSKNDIKQAPIDPSFNPHDISPSDHQDNTLFGDTTSVSYKLWRFNQFFSELEHLRAASKEIYVAKCSFKGLEPGDLSFEKGEQVRSLFAFVDDLPGNWLVGSIDKNGFSRTGFVPGNYLKKIV